MQRITQQLEHHLKLNEQEDHLGKENESVQESHEESDYEDDDNDEEQVEEFSFSLDAVNCSTISAEDAFHNGQIRPFFPLFNRDLLLNGGADVEDLESLRLNDRLPNVKNVFVEAAEENNNGFRAATTSSSSADAGDDQGVVGPSCEWSKKVVQAAPAVPEGCKKSNSTGFSKIWRFKEFMHRSNSDGRDAFVFLNNPTSSTATSPAKDEVSVSLKKVNANNGGGVAGEVKKGKKVKSSKTASLSPHEVYMRSKAKDGERRRSYLPYRPELVGLFTNVTGGGLTRNVHPF
ncbi:hypothetical protein ACH5RR_030703 [Cinchona calisaya]|uniref:Uncharacterized protein n=1 Tax=Cinchona calisaya TaxID=153742 RepID=A0ABD2YVF5_9GENT